MTTVVAICLAFRFFVRISGRCLFCWSDQLVHETIDPGPDRDTDPNRRITKKIVCGKCRRTLSTKQYKANKKAP